MPAMGNGLGGGWTVYQLIPASPVAPDLASAQNQPQPVTGAPTAIADPNAGGSLPSGADRPAQPGSFLSWLSGIIGGNTSSPGSVSALDGQNGVPSGSQGFTFSPPPLVMNGTQIGAGLNFTATAPVAQVDQASQAYSFINNFTANAYGFVGNAINQAVSAAQNLNTQVIGIEQNFGQGEVQALQTEAQALQTAASKLSSGHSGFLGLF